ncbi:histone deacetylase family protein [Planctobacterium marinum]|uniref:Histone deacetylase n=1 Tax=Planctobacterium marinum TaxID=1631968 RepID=A0AA48HRI8_9ALTE|nr:histone deacetylase [Planctobacterium marinum]
MSQLVFHPIYSQLNLPVKHRFPIEKYQGIYDELRRCGVPAQQFVEPQPVAIEALKQVYEPSYVDSITSGELDAKAMRRIGFPWSQQLLQRTLTAVGGTLLCADLALQKGVALNLTGGYHHAFANFGSGFCIFNDLYLAALQMLQQPGIDKVLIFDCDVHQGDGTAKLAQNQANVFTVSLHAEKNFPYRKQHSDMDFPLPKGMSDDAYLEVVDEALHLAFSQFKPDAVIYDAGVDIHQDDDLGHLDISTHGVFKRDRLVKGYCEQAGVPVAAVIGGGYQRDIKALVQVHLQLFRAFGVVQ